MNSGVALKQRSLTLPIVAKPPTGLLDSLRDLLCGVYSDSGVGASDSDDDELRMLQSRSPSATTSKLSADSDTDHSVDEASDYRVSQSTPRHHHRRWRSLRSKQNIANNGPVIIVNGNAGLLCCGMHRKTVGRRKKRYFKRRTTRKDVNTDGGDHARPWPEAPMWTHLQYFAASTPATVAASPTRSTGRHTTLSQAVQTDFASVDAKSIERVFAGESSEISPEIAANVLRTLSSERFSWGTLMRVLQADLQPKDGFGMYTWGVRRRGSQASRLPLPPVMVLRPLTTADTLSCGPPKQFLKIEGSRYTAAGLVRSKQNVSQQTNGCHLPVQWFLPKHDSRTPGELAIIMGRERNKKKKKTTRVSQVGSATTQCTGGFSRTLEEGETKQRNMHVSTRSLHLPVIKGIADDKKTGSASNIKLSRLPVSVTRQWPPHNRYGGSTRGPPDPSVDVCFEFSVVKLPRLDHHMSLISPGAGSLTSIRRGRRGNTATVPGAPPATPVTSIFSSTPSLDVRHPCSGPSSTMQSSSSGSRHTPLYTPALLINSSATRFERQRYQHNKAQQDDSGGPEYGDQPLQKNYSTPQLVIAERDHQSKPGNGCPRQRIRRVHAVSKESVHSHEAVLKMPSIQRDTMNNKFRAGSIIEAQRNKTKRIQKDKDLCSQ